MPWLPPKINWTSADGVTNVDFNRIEANTLDLYNRLNTAVEAINSLNQVATDLANGNYDLTAAQILSKLKTVDGINSGLDADLLRGRSDYMSSSKLYGSFEDNTDIPMGSTYTRIVPLGSDKYEHGKLVLGATRAAYKMDALMAFFGRNKQKTMVVGRMIEEDLVSGDQDQQVSCWTKERIGLVSNDTHVEYQYAPRAAGGSYTGIDDIYLSDSNLIIVFRNYELTRSRDLACYCDWEVW